MANESIGRVALDIEISKKVAEREAIRAAGMIQRAMGRSLQATQQSVKSMFRGLSQGGKQGANDIDTMSFEAQMLSNKLENISTQIEVQQQKLARLREQYSFLNEIGMGDSDRGIKMQEQIARTEASIIRLTQASNKTAQALWKVDDALQQIGDTGKDAAGMVDKAGTRMTETFGRAAKGANNMAQSITKAFNRVLRRVLLFGVMYKVVRGFLGYLGSALKTNKQYAQSLELIKTNLQVAFQPIFQAVLPAIKSLINWLAKATTYIAAFVSTLFGKTYQESFEAAKGLNAAKKGMNDYGAAAKKTMRGLMGFDELNILPSADTGSDSGMTLTAPGADMAGVIDSATNMGQRVYEIMKPIIDWFREAWAWLTGEGKPVLEAFIIVLGSLAAALVIVKVALLVIAAVTAPVSLTVLLVVAAIAAVIAIGILLWKNWDKISAWLVGAWEWIKDAALSAWDGIKGAFSKAKNFFIGVRDGIKSVFRNIATWFRDKFTNAWDAVKKVFSAGGKIFSGIKEGIASTFKTIVNKLISGVNTLIKVPFNKINSMLNTIRSISILGVKPFQKLWGYNPLPVPQIPKLARGGIIDQPTLAMIGENSRKEAVLPLEQNIGWADIIAAKLAESMPVPGGGEDGPLTIQVNIGSKKVLEEIISASRRRNAKAGKTVIQVGVT